jgi:NAD(P)-dependent dehydrogenase (short-subunit alcohol dehydrogenase family)
MKRVAIVTGGTGALGSAIALALDLADYAVHVTTSRANERESYRGAGRAHVVDLRDLGALRDFAAEFEEVHALVLSAGAFAMSDLGDLRASDVDAMLDANFRTAVNALAAFAGKMSPRGAAVLVGSQSYEGAAHKAVYAASKAAVVSLARSAALEFRNAGPRVNAVLPDTIDTEANRRAMPDADFEMWAKPAEIADVVVWLCSEGARVVSGNAIRVGR